MGQPRADHSPLPHLRRQPRPDPRLTHTHPDYAVLATRVTWQRENTATHRCDSHLAELSAGVHQTDDAVERGGRIARLQRVEATFDPLPFDAAAARQYGLIAAGVIAMGREPRRREADLMIAAVAAANRLPLFTTNPDDFQGTDAVLTVVPVPRPET
ncbi:type II toxin-antitoxin system VapC family toxin [Nocardia sp. NPDC019255]|uniref:type II toxin-antitoxin system VapC family toxin n=1 Tax=Nocardia sp. NPDC019255 TaxID=3154591 RepID=UPI0033F95AFA